MGGGGGGGIEWREKEEGEAAFSKWIGRRKPLTTSIIDSDFLLVHQVLALSISAYNIYLLPLDVALQKGQFSTGAAAFMPKLTVSLYTITSIVSMVVVPFIIFWYEGIDDEDDPDAKS